MSMRIVSNLALVGNPRLFLTKLGRRWFRKFPTEANQRFVRNTFRKWCIRDELRVQTNGGFEMFASPHDYASYLIYFWGIYDKDMTNFMRAHIREGDVCWDVGTDRGWFSLLMARIVGPKGRVDSFEAFPPNYKNLTRNLAINSYSWVNTYNLAVSARCGSMYFVPPSNKVTKNVGFLNDCSAVGYLTSTALADTIEVSTISLDKHAESEGIERLHFVKIDVEGAELSVLEGGCRTISRCRPVIAIEYNRMALARAGTSLKDLDKYLDGLDYDRFTFFGRLRRLELNQFFTNKSDEEAVLNVYCMPRR